MAARLDISDPAVIDRVRELVTDELGRVDILVNNAAISSPRPGTNSTWAPGSAS
jgi:NAD(P)-dependent dehydrogenase (short-subunit alcohol dehydrogenase family)